MEECEVCGNEYNDTDPTTEPPACSKDCFWLLSHATNHKDTACWISMEIFCSIGEVHPGTTEAFHRTGYCNECHIFQLDQKWRAAGINKEDLIGNY